MVRDLDRERGGREQDVHDQRARLGGGHDDHGVTTLGTTVAEAYYRLNTLAAEVRRVIQAETLAAAAGTEVAYLAPDAVDFMYRNARDLQYAARDRKSQAM